jgi:hypothetical protein
MGINVKTGPATASYAYVWPDKHGRGKKNVDETTGNVTFKFSCCLLFDKENKKDIEVLETAVRKAFEEGVSKGFFPKTMWEVIKKPLRDGDAEVKAGLKKPNIGYEGRMFLNAYAEGDPDAEYYSPPEITKPLNGKVVAISDHSEFYSGCKCIGALSFYPFKGRQKGIAVGLNALFKIGDGERLDGRESAESAFADFAKEVGTLEGDKATIEGAPANDPFADGL